MSINSTEKPGFQLQLRWAATEVGQIDGIREIWMWITTLLLIFKPVFVTMKFYTRIINRKVKTEVKQRRNISLGAHRDSTKKHIEVAKSSLTNLLIKYILHQSIESGERIKILKIIIMISHKCPMIYCLNADSFCFAFCGIRKQNVILINHVLRHGWQHGCLM